MHVVFRERHGLDEAATPVDLGQAPADLVALSFSDGDLGAFAAGWRRARGRLPSLRLARLADLRHPLSVDTYVERTLEGAKAILVRLIGGEAYWPYGVMQLHDLARRRGIALALLPGDGRPDERLDALSTLPVSTLRRLATLCESGGPIAAQAALAQLALAAGLYAAPVAGDKRLADFGHYYPAEGPQAEPTPDAMPAIAVVFYRSHLSAGDCAPIDRLIEALRRRGFAAHGLFVPSLKHGAAASWLRAELTACPPAAIVNATAFSGREGDAGSPLDTAGCPVFQIALAGARREDWAEAARGLSPADLAMHVVLPEVDGRLFAGVVSFKAGDEPDAELQFARRHHAPDAERIEAVTARIAAWHRLAATPRAERRSALVLSTYPGRADQMAHAVGLDTLASVRAVLGDLAAEGYDTCPAGDLAADLGRAALAYPITDYEADLAALPDVLRAELAAAWGAPTHDPACRDGAFHFAALWRGKALVALQPERGRRETRDADYHDQTVAPCHGYVAFHLWLRRIGVQAIIHMGAHGTLEWLPGKAVALSAGCWPEALAGDLPVIYPFIVNDPGEAAQAKRRIGALTLGHLPPPQVAAPLPEGLRRLERLLDEYSTADGLDPARRDRLIAAIREEARDAGVEADLGLAADASPAEALVRLDRFVCDLKDSRFGDGLHVFGRGECAADERRGLLAALDGRFVAPGPAGSPGRGRADVLPTGRNLFAVDPRAVPTRAAHAQGVKLAEEVLRRHLQDQGDWPRDLVIDLWGSATMRTAGEEFAMALHLAGVAPAWDEGSGRLAGFEVIPLALLARPRIGVTLRISGLFRDVFPDLAALFGRVAATLARRDEPANQNPYRGGGARVFGPAPGRYGAALGATIEDYSPNGRQAAGAAWLAATGHGFDAEGGDIEARVAAADAFIHVHDLPESDILLARDHAAHIGGFAAARGAPVPLYHLDTTRPDVPRARLIGEEIARILRARAGSPRWIDGMMRHGFRGAAEITATLDHMADFAHLAGAVPAHLFDLYHDATLGRAEVVDFMAAANPAALAALRARFRRLRDAGLWHSRRNSILADLEAGA